MPLGRTREFIGYTRDPQLQLRQEVIADYSSKLLFLASFNYDVHNH